MKAREIYTTYPKKRRGKMMNFHFNARTRPSYSNRGASIHGAGAPKGPIRSNMSIRHGWM